MFIDCRGAGFDEGWLYRDASKVEIKVLNLLREQDPRNDK